MTSQIESNEVIDRLVDADPTLSQFLNDDFQSEEYAMKIVTSEVVSDVLDSLNKKRFLIGQMLLYVKSIGQWETVKSLFKCWIVSFTLK